MLVATEMSVTSQSQEYQSFRSTVPQQKIVVDSVEEEDKVWVVYDAGPKSVRCPLIFLPPACGTADIFFKQILSLSSLGYRVMSVEYPVYWSCLEWVEGFRKLLDHFRLDKVHIFGASLGGFLAQKFAEHTHQSPRIHSLILCNAFTDTAVFKNTTAVNFYWMLPGFLLKKMIMDNFTTEEVDPDIADSIDFMVERLDSLGRSEIASRLTLNCCDDYVEPQRLQGITITILDVFDQCAISDRVKEELYKCYPNEKRAHLKTGGNFPYLCRSAEVNLHIQIHLRQFNCTRFSAIDPKYLSCETEEVAVYDDAAPPGPVDVSVDEDTYKVDKFADVHDLIIDGRLEDEGERVRDQQNARAHVARESTRLTPERRVKSEGHANVPVAYTDNRASGNAGTSSAARNSDAGAGKSNTGKVLLSHETSAEGEYASLRDDVKPGHLHHGDDEVHLAAPRKTSNVTPRIQSDGQSDGFSSPGNETDDNSQGWARLRLSPSLRSDEGELEI